MKQRILVCGGTKFTDYSLLDIELSKVWIPHDTLLIHGCAVGADQMSEDWLHRQYPVAEGEDYLRFPADWERYGRAAGPIRNQQMLDEGKPNLVMAFPTVESRGTWDMVRKARKVGVEVRVFGP